ncbi:hypothetical protein POTOM_043251 [Populus tomentosa]|uniref:Uncharacterized protein n=1 Tax=Populus tomentosa TaxID=118781 RepID=A0A8X8CH65_POPTO|nr:hypothetical protein POTOM_043251 [Populus tomentosa]
MSLEHCCLGQIMAFDLSRLILAIQPYITWLFLSCFCSCHGAAMTEVFELYVQLVQEDEWSLNEGLEGVVFRQQA